MVSEASTVAEARNIVKLLHVTRIAMPAQPDKKDELRLLVNSRHPIITVETSEESRVEELLAEVAALAIIFYGFLLARPAPAEKAEQLEPPSRCPRWNSLGRPSAGQCWCASNPSEPLYYIDTTGYNCGILTLASG